MSRISWGKPRIFVKDTDGGSGAKWIELYTPAENTTTLTVTKGDKLEAKIEGGGVEDVKYKRATYSLTFNIRKGKNPGESSARKLPFHPIDGYVDHQFAVMLQPEDPSCEGFLIEFNAVTIDETYSSADGGMWEIQMDALRPASGDTVKWGLVTLSGQANARKIAFSEGSSFDSGNSEETTAKTITDADVEEVSSTEVSA